MKTKFSDLINGEQAVLIDFLPNGAVIANDRQANFLKLWNILKTRYALQKSILISIRP